MDTTKWHTVAIRKECYYKLRGLCDVKDRRPNNMISKLIDEYIKFQANKDGLSYDGLSQKLLEKGKESYVKEG